MKRSLAAAVLVASLAGAHRSLAQTQGPRVGPTDESATGAPVGANDPAAAKKNDGAEKPAADKGGEKGGDKERARQTDTASANSSNVAPAGTPKPPAVSDGPAKSDASASAPPVVRPKGTLSAEPEKGTPNGSASNATPSGNASAPASVLSSTNWAPPAAPAPTSVYHVGVGDVLDIRLLNQPSRESTLYTVMPGGLIEYALAGDTTNVAGMTTDEIAVRLAAEMRRRAVADKPQVLVSVREYASHTVLVSGLVYDPGVKILRRDAIPLYVLIAEAQPKPEAGRALIMSHATGQSKTVDLSDTQGLNTLIQSSDVVSLVARPQEFYYVGGEVGAPGQKDFHAGMTLTQALLASGGTTRFASGAVRVSRQGADGRLSSATHSVALIQEGKVPDPVLQPGDRIEVERKK